MKILKFLGWLFVPYIMIWFQWNKIGTVGKSLGSAWAVIALIGVINSASGANPNPATTQPTTSATASTQAPEPANQEAPAPATTPTADATLPKLGEKVAVGKLEVLANEIKIADSVGNDFLNKKAQGQFLLIDVEIKNLDKEARMIDSSMFKIVDAEGIEYDPDAEASMYANTDNDFFLKNVNPKLSAKGLVIFDMPDDAKGLKLKVDSGVGFAAGESIIIDLNK